MNEPTKDKKANLSYKLKHIFCHDPKCQTCNSGSGHGPFWHAIVDDGETIETIYLGKEFKPIDVDIRPKSKSTDHSQTSTIRAENRFPSSIKKEITKSKSKPFISSKPMPSKSDFERDLRILKTTFQGSRLKSVFRELTKKYHPDNYPGSNQINAWMAEINSQYTQMKKSVRF